MDTDSAADNRLHVRHRSYFSSFHHCFPIIDEARYLLKCNTTSMKCELSCLSQAIWTHGASHSPEHTVVEQDCYRRSRKLLENTEMGEDGADLMTVESLQACLLIALYEFKQMYFVRAWISTCRAVRLMQMLRLHQINPSDSITRQLEDQSQPATALGLADMEERRRTFWGVFILDRFSSTGTDWPTILDENEVC